jgi:hypothetical protein
MSIPLSGGLSWPALLLQPPYRAGARYGMFTGEQGIATAAMVGGAGGAANSPIYACPLPVYRPVTISGLEIAVGTAVAAVTGKMALYGGDLLGGAGTLIAACSGTADMNSVASTNIPLSFSANQTLAPGLYWACAMFDGLAQPWSLSTAAGVSQFGQLVGQPGAVGLIRTAASLQAMRITSANVDYAQAFPASFGAATVGTNAPGSPYIAMVVV